MADPDHESVLSGGNDSGAVIRFGDTVRRKLKPWSPAVHALLRHLELVGFQGAPHVLGIDDHGREILTYIPGEDGRIARCYDDGSLGAVARMVRALHDAVAGFKPPPGCHWRPNRAAPPGTMICHNDLSPANTIYLGGKLQAFIDWDLAVPSTAAWDLSYAVRTFVPLYADRDCEHFGYDPTRRTERLALFCDAYGMDDQIRSDLMPTMLRRLDSETSAAAQRTKETLQQHWHHWASTISAVD